MPIAELFLAAFITVLFERLASRELWNFARRERVHVEIKKWSRMLLIIKDIVSDAEDQQAKNKAAKLWLEELQDLVYDLDDVLDEFAFEEMKQKLDGLIPLPPSTSMVKAWLPTCCTSIPRSFLFRRRMSSEIRAISTRLDDITKQIRDLNLEKISRSTYVNAPSTSRQKTPTTSLIKEPRIWGREKERKEIIELLLRDGGESSRGGNGIGIIPIVGMGGIGKTTLAQEVYNDAQVKERFSLRVWICISTEFDVKKITKEILEGVTSRPCDLKNLDQIQVELEKILATRRFLIVLDDVWNEDDREWDSLKSPFTGGAQGSKVMVTTRHGSVASIMEPVKNRHYLLQVLSFEDCWSIFEQHAFGNKSVDENPELVGIGKEIVERCKGLPLSARVLGGLLQRKDTEEEWKYVLDSEVWRTDDKILPSLQLSYLHLPSHLKPCFSYCSIFPKDYEFTKEETVLLWMAEGLVHREKGNKQLEEDIAGEYFRELVSRSIFQPSSSKRNTESFVMHDLVNDLAQVVAGDVCFRLEDKPKDEENLINFGRARYASYMQGRYDRMEKFESFCKMKRLRTLLPFSIRHSGYHLGSNVPHNLLPKLKFIRAFGLRGYHIYDLPDSVGDMKHLRYLDLSLTDIETLPDWVQTLYNLQTLLLRKCERLNKLPKDMGNLVNLRHFDITYSYRVREMPLGMGNMKSLQKLSDFIVTEGNEFRITELKELRHVGGTLRLSGLQNVKDPLLAKESCLIEKEHLDALTMEWGQTSDEIPFEKEVLDMLQPHKNLKELKIVWYHGAGFPTWLGNPRFSKMVHIEIKDCRNCTALPPLGQLKSLKELYIQGMSSLKQVGLEFYGNVGPEAFPVLEILSFHNMPEWEDWFAFGTDEEVLPFARLNKLVVKNCPKLLGKLPGNLPKLNFLEITECGQLVLEFEDLVHPSLTSLCMDGIEIPFNHSLLGKFENTHGAITISSLRVTNVSIPDSFCNMSNCDENEILANASFHNLRSVVDLEIRNVQKLVYFPKWLSRELKSLKTLEIYHCEELTTLLQKHNHENVHLQRHLPALQRLRISHCPKLVSLYEEEEDEKKNEESKEHQEREQKCMLSLESLDIWSSEKVEKLLRCLFMFRSLVKLQLYDCPKLISFPETGFPSALRTLEVRECKALESPLPLWNNDNNLETLFVSCCRSLVCLASSYSYSSSSSNIGKRGGLPSSLKELYISHCDKLEALIEGGEEMKINCPSLESISIWNCESLGYLPDTLHDDSLGKLSSLSISYCKKLGYNLDGWTHAMSNLTKIWIERCNNLMRMVSYIVKEASVFTNLTRLGLRDITVGMHPSEWGLHRLSSLRELWISGPIIRVAAEKKEGEEGRVGEEEVVEVSVFPLQGMLLPTSLTELSIWDFPDLVRLSFEGFECLSSLQYLTLINCPRLAYLPEGEGGGSGWLPSTLLQLHIFECPKLKEKCERGKGQYWPIISHIPYLDIR